MDRLKNKYHSTGTGNKLKSIEDFFKNNPTIIKAIELAQIKEFVVAYDKAPNDTKIPSRIKDAFVKVYTGIGETGFHELFGTNIYAEFIKIIKPIPTNNNDEIEQIQSHFLQHEEEKGPDPIIQQSASPVQIIQQEEPAIMAERAELDKKFIEMLIKTSPLPIYSQNPLNEFFNNHPKIKTELKEQMIEFILEDSAGTVNGMIYLIKHPKLSIFLKELHHKDSDLLAKTLGSNPTMTVQDYHTYNFECLADETEEAQILEALTYAENQLEIENYNEKSMNNIQEHIEFINSYIEATGDYQYFDYNI